MRRPSEAEQRRLGEAIAHNFPPCCCGLGAGRVCLGHAFLSEYDGFLKLPRWLRLDYVRSVRSRFQEAEFRGCVGCKAPECLTCARMRILDESRPEEPTTLPW